MTQVQAPAQGPKIPERQPMEYRVDQAPVGATADELLLLVAQRPADVRDWAEREGYANLKDHIDSAGVVSAQAATTLTLLLSGLAGALAFAVKVFEPAASPVAWGAAALCAWLTALAAMLVVRNISLAPAPMLHNQPGNVLLLPGSLEALRMGELVNLEMRIRCQQDINVRRAAALNQVRWSAIASPAVFAVAATLAARV